MSRDDMDPADCNLSPVFCPHGIDRDADECEVCDYGAAESEDETPCGYESGDEPPNPRPRKLTLAEYQQGLADRGIDTIEDYEDRYGCD